MINGGCRIDIGLGETYKIHTQGGWETHDNAFIGVSNNVTR